MSAQIPFNIPLKLGHETQYIADAIDRGALCGDGHYTKECQSILTKLTGKKALLTTSCTAALEMAATLLDIGPGDEVIMPSYTFVTSANAFVSRGASIVFVDIRPDTLNIDEKLIEAAITAKTKAIVPVHYAGVACEMDTIISLAKQNNLAVIEDAAQGVMSTYKGRALGSIGDLGCYSFHDTKNYTAAEGGALIIGNEQYGQQANIAWQKGTNRAEFIEGRVDKYTWVGKGSSFLPSELNAAYLYDGLNNLEVVNHNRLASWQLYYELLQPLQQSGHIELPTVPANCQHNAHMFYILAADLSERNSLMAHLADKDITSVFHYIPLHTAPAGQKYGRFVGQDKYTTTQSQRLLRLPMYYNLTAEQINYTVQSIIDFYK